MEEFFHVLKHALVDTAKLVPFLVLVYILIEFLEYKNIFRFEKSKLLNGKVSPVIGAVFGSVPQCGFSVISSELYSKQKISIAALISVFVATSDEAIPLMLANYKTIPALLVLIATKIILAILIGYLTLSLYKVFFKKSNSLKAKNLQTTSQISEIEVEEKHHNHHDEEHNHEINHDSHESENKHNEEELGHIHACCHHDLQDHKFDWKHPLIHSLKISLYIFLINFALGGLIEIVGEEKFVKFLSSSNLLQPVLALLIGLIPNCVSSVVLTELFLMGGLSFGAIVTGLSVNAGLGLLVLFKENKNKKENIFILLMLIIPSLIFGYALHFIPLNLLKF